MTEAASMNWSREFDEPIVLPDGGELRTLLDAGRYVDALPRSMHERKEWQAVMEVLISAVGRPRAGELAANCSHAGPAGKRPDERATALLNGEAARLACPSRDSPHGSLPRIGRTGDCRAAGNAGAGVEQHLAETNQHVL
jgi:hypothetical protein